MATDSATVILRVADSDSKTIVRFQRQTHRKVVYRPFQFHERSQLFISTHDETLSVAVRVHDPHCSSLSINS